MYAKLENGKLIPAPKQVQAKGYRVMNPPEALLRELGYKQVIFDAMPETPCREQYTQDADYIHVLYVALEKTPDTRTYEQRVEEAIRMRYSVSDELAILRQRNEKPDEFADYYAFCEDVKASAKLLQL